MCLPSLLLFKSYELYSHPYTNIVDRPVSKYVKNDKFCFKKAYNDIFSVDENFAKEFVLIWKCHAPPKIMWKVWIELLPSRQVLAHRGIKVS